MHTIQAQFSIQDITAALNVFGVNNRDTLTDNVIIQSVTVLTGANLHIDLGLVVNPRRFTAKLISGDPVDISLDNETTFQIQLRAIDDFAVIPLSSPPSIYLSSSGTSNVLYSIDRTNP